MKNVLEGHGMEQWTLFLNYHLKLMQWYKTY